MPNHAHFSSRIKSIKNGSEVIIRNLPATMKRIDISVFESLQPILGGRPSTHGRMLPLEMEVEE